MPSETYPDLGKVIAGKFVLKDILGTGAMGTVYRAEQITLGRTVAVKVLNPSLARDPEVIQRFHQEARAASRINHPNTIAIIDFGETPGGLLYLVMEYVRGRTLTEVLRQEFPLSPQRTVDILCQVLAGLHEAHELGVIHRDLKPDNILVERLRTGADHVKVCDFGIAQLQDKTKDTEPGALIETVCGTPDYMAPEQIRGEPVDARCDLYAAGVVLYEMLTGEVPFVGATALDVCMQHLEKQPIRPHQKRPDLSIAGALEETALRALSKNVADRFASALELREALEGSISRAAASGARCMVCDKVGPPGSAFCAWCGGALRRITAPPPAATSTTSTSSTTKSSKRVRIPFVGRERDLNRVGNFLGQTGARSLVLIGAPGAGKTRLLHEAIRRGEGRAWRILRFGPDPSGTAEPWYPIRRAVAALLDCPLEVGFAELRDKVIGQGLDDADAMPGLAELFRLAGAETGLELAVRRRECSSAALRVIRGNPKLPATDTVLVFEDVDRYDRPSRAVVERLVESPGDGSLCVIATAAPGVDADEWGATESFLLEPLSTEAIVEAAKAFLGSQPGAEQLGKRLAAETAGLPLHLEQAIHVILEGGVVEAGNLADLTISRLQALPAAPRRILQISSVFGQHVRRDSLERMKRPADDLGDALETLVERGFMNVRSDGTITFAHPFLGDAAYDAIPVDARRELHLRVLEDLERVPSRPAVQAHHSYEAGVGMPAIALLERAGLECQAAFDDHGATVHYRRAWELARWAFLRGDDAEGEVLSRIGLRLGEAMFWSGDALAVEGVLQEALEHSQSDPASQARVHAALGRLAMTRNHSQQARASLGSAIERAMRAGDPELLAELYVQLAGVLEHDDDLESALRELMEGCMLCTAGGDALTGLEGPPILWRLLLKLAEIHGLRADPQTAIRYGQAALKHAERVGSPVGRARAHELLADLLMVAGRPGPSREHRLQAVEAMRHLGDRRSTAKLLLDLARDDLRSGQADRAKERLHEARHLARAVEWIEGVKRAEIAMS